MNKKLELKQQAAAEWFESLRNDICAEFEKIEQEYSKDSNNIKLFNRKSWQREGGGGGQMSIMKGEVFEKVGVNISTVWGDFDKKFAKEIPGAEENPSFWASGISLVAHMKNPKVPAVHMNTRFICTTKAWFGGGADLTPAIENPRDTKAFHEALQTACDKFNPDYYTKYKARCDEYFDIPHRGEARGVGGIFYDYLDSGTSVNKDNKEDKNWQQDFAFTKQLGKAFLDIYPQIVRLNMHEEYNQQDVEKLLHKRGRYVEFNLLYDRGTRFGIMTGGNPEAVLMSLPPLASWE